MNLDDVAPDLQPLARRFIRVRVPTRPLQRRALQALLAILPSPVESSVRLRTLRTPTVLVRHYAPSEVRTSAALFWIHGGGMIGGSPRQDHPLCSGTAAELGMHVFSFAYRFAPEHPFPAAHEDLVAGWRWLQDNAHTYGVDPARVVVGGESAGGGLAASLVQWIHDHGDVQPLGQWLFAPMLDDRTAADRALDGVDHVVWNNALNRFGWSSFLSQEPGLPTVPQYAVASRREDLTGLPPAFITWGDIELFAAEDDAYADRLRTAGVDVTTDVVHGAPHGAESWARKTPTAVALLGRARGWLRDLID